MKRRGPFNIVMAASVAVACLAITQPAFAQNLEWIARVPRVPHISLFSSHEVYHDKVRDRLLTIGWEMGTVMISTDDGRTWYGDYSIYTDVVKKEPWMKIFDDGVYLYKGKTPWNADVALLSEDGGSNFRGLTKDPRIRRADGHASLQMIIEPNVLVTNDTSYFNWFMSKDYGASWQAIERPILDVSYYVYHQPEPYVMMVKGPDLWHALDTRTDTAWRETNISRLIGEPVIIGNVVVGTRNRQLAVRRHPDSAFTLYDNWPDPGTDTNARIEIDQVLRATDSSIYAFDQHGFIFVIEAPSGNVRLLHRERFLTPYSQQVNHGETKYYDGQFLSIYSDSWGYWYNGKRNRTFLHIDVATETVSRVVTKSRHSFIGGPVSSTTFLGDNGLFMMSNDSEFREVVRSTDHGETWWHSEEVNIDLLDPLYLPIRSALRLPNDSLVMQSTYDHVIVRRDNGWLEPRQYATDAEDWERYSGGYGHKTSQFRRPTLTMDQGKLYTFDPFLVELDPETMFERDTVLPRRASFLRRLTPTFLAAGRDSLWLSFNNGEEWIYVPAGMTGDEQRGAVSDVVYLRNGTLLCGYRGMDWVDTANTSGLLYRGGMFMSTDDGNTWTSVSGWPEEQPHVGTMTVLPSGTILANAAHIILDAAMERDFRSLRSTRVTRAGVWRSDDGGHQWTEVFTDYMRGAPFPDIERSIVAVSSGAVVATTLTGLVIVSKDDGRSWEILDIPALGSALIYGLSLDKDGSLLVSTSEGVARMWIPGATSVEERADHGMEPRLHVADGRLHVQGLSSPSTIEIYDILGRQLLQEKAEAGTYSIPLLREVRGPLAYRIVTDNTMYTGVVYADLVSN